MSYYETTQDKERVQYHVPLAKAVVPPPGEGHGHYHDSSLGGPCAVTPAGYHPYQKGVVFSPTGTADATRFAALLTSQQSQCPGAPIHFDAGTYDIDDSGSGYGFNLSGKQDIVLKLHPATVLTSAAGLTAGMQAYPSGTNTSTTVQTTSTQFSNQLIVAAAVAIGSRIAIQDTASTRQWYRVTSASGTGPCTLTLDRHLRRVHTAGTTVLVYPSTALPERITIEGRGATLNFQTASARLVNFAGAQQVHLRDLLVYGNTPDEGVYFDTGCADCSMHNVRVDTGSIEIASGENITLSSCKVLNSNSALEAGILLLDADNCRVVDCVADGGTGNAFTFSANGGTGSTDCVADHCSASGYTVSGFVTTGNAARTTISNSYVYGCGTGISVAADSTDTVLNNVTIVSCGTGLSVSAATNARNVRINGCTNGAINTSAQFFVDGLENLAAATAVVSSIASVNADAWFSRVKGPWRLHCNGTASAYSRIEIRDSDFTTNNANSAVDCYTKSVVLVENTKITKVTGGEYAVHVYKFATLRLGSGCDFVGWTTPVLVDAGGHSSRGTVTLNGATGVVYPFRDLKADPCDQVFLARKTAGGTAGPPPVWAKTIGQAVATGNVDLTGLTYPTVFGTNTLKIWVDCWQYTVTFANPANAAEVVAQINAVLGARATASLSTNFLRITSANTGTGSSIAVEDGTLAAATVGFTSLAETSGCYVTVTGTALDTSVYAIEIR